MKLNEQVSAFLDAQNHPFRNEIEILRNCILSSKENLTENIKWNGPNYCYNHEDRITMRIMPPGKTLQLIFHRGAKKQEQPKEKLIANTSNMLVWKENDRAIISFKSLRDIEKAKVELANIVRDWIDAAK